jgi:hypothetical protein
MDPWLTCYELALKGEELNRYLNIPPPEEWRLHGVHNSLSCRRILDADATELTEREAGEGENAIVEA